MKTLFVVALSIFLCSCKQKEKATEPEASDPLIEFKANQMADSIIESAKQDVLKDQQKISQEESPVKVTKARISTDEYGSMDIVATVKNTSTDLVDGIKVRWILTNNFGEIVNELRNGGISQDLLRPGRSATYRWSLYRTTATKVTAFVYEVHFKNGATWSARK